MAAVVALLRKMSAGLLAAVRDLFATLRHTPLRQWPTISFGVGSASLLIAGSFLLSAAFGVLRQILFNARFGIGEDAAALYAALRMSQTLTTLVTGGVLTNALIPGIVPLLTRGAAEVNRHIGRLLSVLLAVLLPIVLATIIFAPQLIDLIAAGLQPSTRQLATLLTRLTSLEVLIVTLEGLFSAVLVARRWFLLPAGGIVLRNALIIAALLFPQADIVTIALASLGDGVIQLLILIPGLIAAGFRIVPAWAPRDHRVRGTLQLFRPAALSALLNYSGGTVDTALATIGGAAAGLGAISNAFLLIGLPIRLIGVAPAQAALPRLTALAARPDLSDLRRLMRLLLGTAFAISVPLAAAFVLIGVPLVSTFFQRGAFDQDAVRLTAAALGVFAPAIPAAIATELMTRMLLAFNDSRSALIGNIVQQTVRIGIAVLLLPTFGALAVPIGYAVSSYVECCILALFLLRRNRQRQHAP